MIFKVLSKSGTHNVTVETKPAENNPAYTIYTASDGESFRCSGLLKPGDDLKKAITRQVKRMWIGVTSIKVIK